MNIFPQEIRQIIYNHDYAINYANLEKIVNEIKSVLVPSIKSGKDVLDQVHIKNMFCGRGKRKF